MFWIIREHGWKIGRTGHYRGSQVQDQLEPPLAHSSHLLLHCSRHWSVPVEGCSSLCIPRWNLSHALLTQFARTLTLLGFHIDQPEKKRLVWHWLVSERSRPFQIVDVVKIDHQIPNCKIEFNPGKLVTLDLGLLLEKHLPQKWLVFGVEDNFLSPTPHDPLGRSCLPQETYLGKVEKG